MGAWDEITAELPSLKRATLLLVGLALGFPAGLWWRSEQVSTIEGRLLAKDEKISDLERRLTIAEPSLKKVESVDPTFADQNSEPLAPKDFRVEPLWTGNQKTLFEAALKASPSSISIRRSSLTPKLFADYIQGTFKSSGWNVKVTVSLNTTDEFVIKTFDLETSKNLLKIFDDAKLAYNAFEDDPKVGSMTFWLTERN
jgi:hypothetical protein